MSAQLAPITDLAAQAATLLMRGEDTAADAGLFAAQFKELLGQQLKGAGMANPLSAVIDTAQAADADLGEDLAALLPFIEALGLTQTLPTEDALPGATIIDAIQSQLADAADAPLLAPLTPAVAIPASSPAITAANAQAQALPQAANSPVQTSLPALVETGFAQAIVAAATDTSPDALPAGRDFSAQLVAALATSKEAPQTPGNIAAVAQQIIAQGSPGQAPAATQADLAIAQPVGAPGWTEEIGNRIAWLANRSESRADLVLTPPQMGRVEISLSIKGDQAVANFVSSNPVVREALEAALPRLREVLAEAGIQLGQAQVSADNARQWAQQEKHGENFTSDRDRESSARAAISQTSSGSLSSVAGLKAGRGLVDVFA
jgi:flagellar hook-length control protein FliK